jgi:hypothetical protein
MFEAADRMAGGPALYVVALGFGDPIESVSITFPTCFTGGGFGGAQGRGGVKARELPRAASPLLAQGAGSQNDDDTLSMLPPTCAHGRCAFGIGAGAGTLGAWALQAPLEFML